MIIGKTRTNQPVEKTEGFDVEVQDLMEQGEPMSGYSFRFIPKENLTIEGIYAGAVKNGNKLTLVLACNLTRTDTVVGDPIAGEFTVPSDILSKLYPTLIGSDNYLDLKEIDAWVNDTSKKTIATFMKKSNTLNVVLNVTNVNSLVANTKYYYRYEVTFLLSDNLIPQE